MSSIQPKWLNPPNPRAPGVYTDISDRAYHAIPALRWSTLSAALTSPRHLRHALTTTRGDSPAMNFGRAMHLRVLQPDVYERAVDVVPDEYMTGSGNLSTSKAARAWAAEAKEAAEAVVTPREHEDLDEIAALIESHPAAVELLAEAPLREVVAIWHEHTAAGLVVCKARADMLGDGRLADLKSWTPRGEFGSRKFGAEMWDRNYHAQLGWYERGLVAAGADYDPGNWSFLAIDKRRPFDVGVFDVGAESADLGSIDAAEALHRCAEALRSQQWEWALPGRTEVDLPGYAFGDTSETGGLVGFGGGDE